MATITHQTTEANKRNRLVLWETMGNADSGTPIPTEDFTVASFQAVGTWGSATLVIQGSNDGTNWATLENNQGDALSVTADAFDSIGEMPRLIRPTTSGGSGTDVDVYVYQAKS